MEKELELLLIRAVRNFEIPFNNCKWSNNNVDFVELYIGNSKITEVLPSTINGTKTINAICSIDIEQENLNKECFEQIKSDTGIDKPFYEFRDNCKGLFSTDGEINVKYSSESNKWIVNR